MSKTISKIAFAIILLYLGFTIVNKAFESKYSETHEFLKLPIFDLGIFIKRDENMINIMLFHKKINIPSTIEFLNPLLRR